MSFAHTQYLNVASAGQTLSRSFSKSGGTQTSVDESVPDSSSDLEIAFTLDVSACKSFYMVSDVALTIETNNGGAPDDTIVLVAGIPYVWHEGDYHTFLLGTDVTALFATNASGSAAALKIEALSDPTP